MAIKTYLIIASYMLTLFIGWHLHTWYDGYQKEHEEAAIIKERVAEEKASNVEAAKVEKKEVDDETQAKKSDAAVEKHIAANKPGFGCAVPAIGVRDLQQAVTSHTRASKSNGAMP